MSEHKSWEEKTPEERAEAAAKLKACNDRSYARMAEINRIASETLVKTTHGSYTSGQYGQDYRAFGKAMCEIRKVVKESVFDVDPDYEMLARQFARPFFDADKLAKAIEALASEQPIDYPTFYTPGWLVDLAKKIEAEGKVKVEGEGEQRNVPLAHFPSGADGTEPAAIEHAPEKQQPQMTVVRAQRLGDIGMVMDKRVSKGENGVVTRIHYAGIRHVSAARPAQLWEIDVVKDDTGSHITCRRDHERVFSGEAFFGLSHAADVAISMMIRKIIGDTEKKHRDHFRRIRRNTAETKALIEKELA